MINDLCSVADAAGMFAVAAVVFAIAMVIAVVAIAMWKDL
jgi:hypothetical protein